MLSGFHGMTASESASQTPLKLPPMTLSELAALEDD
jgi:hypothetical protein